MSTQSFYITIFLAIALTGCATIAPDVVGENSQVAIRQTQTRHYDTLDRKMTMRSVIATLQDLGFIVDTADPDLGLVTGTRLHDYTMRMTVTVVRKNEMRIAVRANARINEIGIDDARTYQDFFIALDKAMFLTLNQVD